MCVFYTDIGINWRTVQEEHKEEEGLPPTRTLLIFPVGRIKAAVSGKDRDFTDVDGSKYPNINGTVVTPHSGTGVGGGSSCFECFLSQSILIKFIFQKI